MTLEDSQPVASAGDGTIPPLHTSQLILYGVGGIAGGLVFTMMNNALPLFLKSYTMPVTLAPLFREGDAIPAVIVALLANERSLFGGLIQPLIGSLSDRTRTRIGKRSPYILLGGIGTALCIAALAFQPPFWLMIAIVTLGGISLFTALGPYVALLADITPYSQRGRAGGLTALAGVVGAVVFTLMSNQLWETHKGIVFVMTGIGVALSMIVVAFGVQESHELELIDNNESKKKTRLSDSVRGIVSYRPLLTYTVSMGVYWLGAGAAAPFITRFGVEELGISEGTSFILLLVIVLGTAVGAIASGFLADKIGRKRLLRPSLVLFAVAAIASAFVANIWQILPVLLLVGLGNGVPTALHLPFLADLVPRNRAGEFMGFASMIWSVAQPLGSLLAGMLVDMTHSYRGVFIFAGICMLAASWLLRRVPERIEEGELQLSLAS